MGKFKFRVIKFIKRLDTSDARKSVAEDLKKASSKIFGLFLVSVPGQFSTLLHAVAVAFGVDAESLKVSTATLAVMLLGAFGMRLAAFMLEIDVKDEPKKTGKSGRK